MAAQDVVRAFSRDRLKREKPLAVMSLETSETACAGGGTTMQRVLLLPLLLTLALTGVFAAESDSTQKPEDVEAKKLPFVEMHPQALHALRIIQSHIAYRQKPSGAFTSDQNPGEDALCGLALMTNGSNAGVGPYGKEVALLTNYLLGLQDNTGFIPSKNGQHGMYGHALSTLFLSEVWGMSRQPDLRDKLRKAVQLIVDCQNKRGGWSYYPKIEDRTDLSVTVMQVMALRSANEAGIHVPKDTIDKAVEAIRYCFEKKSGGFGYTGPHGAKFSTTGAGVTALQTVGVYHDEMVERGLRYLKENAFKKKEWFWYGHYYISVAMYHEGGEAWEEYYPKIRKIAIEKVKSKNFKQEKLWEISFMGLVLGTPYRYIPIYQR